MFDLAEADLFSEKEKETPSVILLLTKKNILEDERNGL